MRTPFEAIEAGGRARRGRGAPVWRAETLPRVTRARGAPADAGVRRLGGAGAPRPAPARYAPTPRSDLYRRERACTNRHRICAGRVGIIDGTANVRPPAILVQLSLSTAASSAPNAFGGQNADGVSGGSMVEGRPRCSRERGRGVLGPERPRLRAPGSRSRPARAGGARVTPDGHPKHGSRAPRTGRFWAAPTAKGKIALHASRGPSRGSPTGLRRGRRPPRARARPPPQTGNTPTRHVDAAAPARAGARGSRWCSQRRAAP